MWCGVISGETAEDSWPGGQAWGTVLEYNKWRAVKAVKMSQSQQGRGARRLLESTQQWFLDALCVQVSWVVDSAVNRIKLLACMCRVHKRDPRRSEVSSMKGGSRRM